MKQETPVSKTIGLLAEVRDLCEENGIQYYLSPYTLIRALRFGTLEEDFAIPEVYMTLDDFLRFIDMVEQAKPAGRAVEYMGNSDTYPSFSAEYVDENSTYIALGRGTDFSRPGLRVTIGILRNDVNNVFANLLETGWENDSFNPPIDLTGKKRIALSYARMRKKASQNAAEKTFRKLCDVYGKKSSSEQYFVRSYRRSRYYLPKALFKETTEVELDGESFKVPKDYESYLKVFFGENPENAALRGKTEQNYLISANVPYEEYIKHMEEAGMPLDSIFRAHVKLLLASRGSRETLTSRDQSFVIAQRSNDRRVLYEKLNPQMDTIRDLRSSKKYDELAVIFSDYTELAKYYLKKGLSLCPSEELLEIECEVLDYLGETKRSEKLKELAPPQHKEPLIKATTEQ